MSSTTRPMASTTERSADGDGCCQEKTLTGASGDGFKKEMRVNDHNIVPLVKCQAKNLADISSTDFIQQDWYDNIPGNVLFTRPFCIEHIHPLLNNPADTQFVIEILFHLATIVPLGLYLLFISFSWTLAGLYLFLFNYKSMSFTLMLHCTSHKALFKKRYGLLNGIIPYLLCPFMGQTWNSYYYHHVKMHHIEENGPSDLSSTLRYQRDSFAHFLIYFGRFLFLSWIDLPRYHLERRNYRACFDIVWGEFGFILMMYLCAAYGNAAYSVLTVFVLPLVLIRGGMMSGNWGQHAFIAHDDPDCNWKSSITVIECPYNDGAFNDGYHTSHHLNPHRHFTSHPLHLLKNQSKYASHASLVLKNIDFHGVWFHLMTQNWDHLADCYVPLTSADDRKSKAEIIAHLKDRVRPFSEEEICKFYPTKGTTQRMVYKDE